MSEQGILFYNNAVKLLPWLTCDDHGIQKCKQIRNNLNNKFSILMIPIISCLTFWRAFPSIHVNVDSSCMYILDYKKVHMTCPSWVEDLNCICGQSMDDLMGADRACTAASYSHLFGTNNGRELNFAQPRPSV